MVSSIFPLTISGATVRKRGKQLLGPLDLTLSETGFTMLIGPNGAGKTTLLRMMHGMERLSSGALSWAIPDRDAQDRMAFVFQRPTMMRRSVLDNVAYPLRLTGASARAARAEAHDWLARVGLAEAADRPANVLSGGERQKLALARALIRKPEVLFLDEPCANLDGRATREFEELLQEVHSQGTRIIMSTHDMGQARRLASEVLFIHHGQVHEHGPTEAFFADAQTPEARAFINGDIVE